MTGCRFVPSYLLETLASSSPDELLGCVRETLDRDSSIRARRRQASAAPAPDRSRRAVSDAGNTDALPGRLVRAEGDPATGDLAVDEAYDGMGATWSLFHDVYGRDSLDGRGHPLDATVHYLRNYDNAFWDGSRLVFGDGDGVIFERFTKPLDVIAHEFTHGVTQFTAALVYQGQPGSLNESVSDVFAALTQQRLLRQPADQASWLIGEGLFTPDINARALRSMAEPGTAYDDPRIGRDPQPGRMSDFVDTTDDNGGVHINSGIPNRAFHLVATAIGGNAWETAGQIWFDTLVDERLSADADFAAFAALTTDVAERAHGTDSPAHRAVVDAWATVEVTGEVVPSVSEPVPVPAPEPAPEPVPVPAPEPVPVPASGGGGSGRVVVVRRSGGFAGIVLERRIDTAVSQRGPQVERLLGRVDLASVPTSRPQPDAYVFSIAVGDAQVVVQELDLTPELAELVGLVLHDDGR